MWKIVAVVLGAAAEIILLASEQNENNIKNDNAKQN
jgi:hypothetical protein